MAHLEGRRELVEVPGYGPWVVIQAGASLTMRSSTDPLHTRRNTRTGLVWTGTGGERWALRAGISRRPDA